MDNELLPLIRELCHIAATRNEINMRRHRARFRKNYYANAIRVVEAHKGSNWKLRKLHPDKYQAKIDSIKSEMEYLKKEYPKPKKWLAMGLHQLRSLMLKGEGEYALAKHETMELSLRTTDRVKEIMRITGAHIRYDNGSIVNVNVNDVCIDIQRYAKEFELGVAVSEMLQE